jgi:hypothetical protein
MRGFISLLARSGGPGMSPLAPQLGAQRTSSQPTENDATDPHGGHGDSRNLAALSRVHGLVEESDVH